MGDSNHGRDGSRVARGVLATISSSEPMVSPARACGRDGVWALAQVAHRRARGGEVDHLVPAHHDDRWPIHLGPPHPTHEGRLGGVDGQRAT